MLTAKPSLYKLKTENKANKAIPAAGKVSELQEGKALCLIFIEVQPKVNPHAIWSL
jgi:hypothetical protein